MSYKTYAIIAALLCFPIAWSTAKGGNLEYLPHIALGYFTLYLLLLVLPTANVVGMLKARSSRQTVLLYGIAISISVFYVCLFRFYLVPVLKRRIAVRFLFRLGRENRDRRWFEVHGC